MKFSTKVRYGVRAMIELACRYDGQPVQLASVAEHQDISAKYLHAVMQQLKVAGLVRAIRGARGGFILTRHPSKIRLVEVVEAIDGPVRVVDCVHADCSFDRPGVCVARMVWCDVSDAIRDVLTSKTLADLADEVKCNQEGPIGPPCP